MFFREVFSAAQRHVELWNLGLSPPAHLYCLHEELPGACILHALTAYPLPILFFPV